MINKKTIIISIAAVSGGGKTTVTNCLNEILPNSKPFYFDDYNFEGPDDIVDWVERGADCNEWKLEPLIFDINAILLSQDVEYILLDYPFSRLHNELKHIDLTVFIDTPLDIAMARRIIRDYKDTESEHIVSDLNHYLSRGRRAYQNMLNTVKPNSDLILDGTLPVSGITNEIYNKVKQ